MKKMSKEKIILIIGIILLMFMYIFYHILDPKKLNIGILRQAFGETPVFGENYMKGNACALAFLFPPADI